MRLPQNHNRLRAVKVGPAQCWKHAFIVSVDRKTRWHVGQQYSGMFYNHPFWAYKQVKRWWGGWRTIGEYPDPFYQLNQEPMEVFQRRVGEILRTW